jgi:hypothetical protein
MSLDGYCEGPGKNVMALFDYRWELYPTDESFDAYNAERLRAADTCRLLVSADVELPVRLYPDPAPRILAPVVAVRRSPRFRSLIVFDRICRVVGGDQHLRVVGVLFPIGGAPRSGTVPRAPGVRERNRVVYVDLRRICQRPPRIRVDLRPCRYGTVFVDSDAIAVSPRGLSRTHR